MEHTIGTGELETGTIRHAHQGWQVIILAARRGAREMQSMRMAEHQPHAPPLADAESQQFRTAYRRVLHAVDIVQGAVTETFAGRALVGRMHVVAFAAVDGANRVHVVDGLRGVPLGFAQHRPAQGIAIVLGGMRVDPLRQLHDEERQILAPQSAPFTDHHAKQLTVGTAVLLVLLALIPQETRQGVRHDAFQHRVERPGRAVWRRRRDRRRPWAFAILLVQLILRDAGVRLARGEHLRVPPVELPLPLGGLQIELALRFAGNRTPVAIEVSAAGLAGIQRVLAHPAADRRAADIAVDDADRHIGIELVAQSAGEIIGDRAHHAAVFRRGFPPARRAFGVTANHAGFGHVVEAEQRIGAILQ